MTETKQSVTINKQWADVAELADAIDLGSIVNRRAGSSPVIRMHLYRCCIYSIFFLREGTRQAEMLAFPFAAAREREKLAERVSHRCHSNEENGRHACMNGHAFY